MAESNRDYWGELLKRQQRISRLIAAGWTVRTEVGRKGPRWVLVPPNAVSPNEGAS